MLEQVATHNVAHVHPDHTLATAIIKLGRQGISRLPVGQHRILTVQAADAENGETRTIPLNRFLWEALDRLRKNRLFQGKFVFVSSKEEPFRSIRTAFTTACQHANLAAVSPHVLRHTLASRLAMAGADIRTLQELGGWKEIKMVERYAHLSTQHKAEAIGKISHPTSEDSPTVFTTPEKQSA